MLKYVVNILIYLSLSVLIGSIVFFGFGVASLVFKDQMLPSRTVAGALNSAVLSRLGMLVTGASVVLLLGAFYAAFKYTQWMNWTVLGLAVLIVGCSYFTTSVLFPKMDHLRTEIGNFDEVPAEKASLKLDFDGGHKTYTQLTMIALAGGVLALMLHTIGLIRYAEVRRGSESMTIAPAPVPKPMPASAPAPTVEPAQKKANVSKGA